MTKEMIISSTPHETRVAILEDDQVVEIFIEREHSRGVVGNIYKGRVSKVLPGMQSAFVDLGLERDAFLYVTDVISPTEEALEEDDDPAVSLAAPEPLDGDAPGDDIGNRMADPGAAPAAGVARPENGDARRGGDRGDRRNRERPERQPPSAKIEDLLKEGQEVVVQVVKEPLGTKGARITSHLSLPGRFLVYMPTVDHIGVSRKIESRDERRRLRGIVQRFREQSGLPGGVIIRTAASNRTEEDIVADLTYFQQVWTELQRKRESDRTPAVLFREESLVTKLLRDLLTEQYTSIRIDDATEHRRVMSLISRIMPNMAGRVKHYTKEYPIFEEYAVQGEVDKALRSKVWLKSGGYIVINQTEALVAIDVNTGRYTGKKDLEETILKTNLEAVKEIVRQIRLRDLGGIIVLDFIDMEEGKSRKKVMAELEQELRRDRSPSKMISVNEFGLVILTRKRVKLSLERLLCQPCPYCTGAGTIKSVATVCSEIYAEVRKLAADVSGQPLLLRVNPDVARALMGEEAPVLRELGVLTRGEIMVQGDPLLHQEQFDLVPR